MGWWGMEWGEWEEQEAWPQDVRPSEFISDTIITLLVGEKMVPRNVINYYTPGRGKIVPSHQSCNFITEHIAANRSASHAISIASVCKKQFGVPKGGLVETRPTILGATALTVKLHAMQSSRPQSQSVCPDRLPAVVAGL